MQIKGASCSHCHEQLQKYHLTNDQRDLLLLGIEAMTRLLIFSLFDSKKHHKTVLKPFNNSKKQSIPLTTT